MEQDHILEHDHHQAQLRGWQLAWATSVALALGLVMVLLKDVVLLHLH